MKTFPLANIPKSLNLFNIDAKVGCDFHKEVLITRKINGWMVGNQMNVMDK